MKLVCRYMCDGAREVEKTTGSTYFENKEYFPPELICTHNLPWPLTFLEHKQEGTCNSM